MYKPLTCGCYWVFNSTLLNLHGVKDFLLVVHFCVGTHLPRLLSVFNYNNFMLFCSFELCCIFFKQLLCFFLQIYYSKQHILGIVAGFVLLVLVCYLKHGV